MTGNLLVITGAGASKAAVPEAPLADQLFSPRYDSIYRLYREVDGLRLLLQSRLARGQDAGRTLEEILGDVLDNPEQGARAAVSQIPVYLREVFETHVRSSRPTLYDELIMHARHRGVTLFFVTLNYDRLIEEAIERRYEVDDFFASMESYISRDEWKLIKLHGSVDWVHPTPRGRSSEPQYTPGATRVDEFWRFLYQLPETVHVDPEGLRVMGPRHDRWFDGSSLLYPALSIPQNRGYDSVCPTSHVNALTEFLSLDPAVLVIGNRGLDNDLMRHLRTGLAAPRGRKREKSQMFCVVDPGDPSEISRRFADAMGFARYPEPSPQKFEDWMASDEVENFMNSVAVTS